MPFLFQQLYPHPSVPGQSAGDWVIFKNAIMDNSQCCPARTSLLTGQRARNTGVTTNFCAPYFEPVTPTTEPQCNVSVTSDSTIARRLHDSGYRTAMLGKYLNDFPWDLSSNYIPSGWDDWSTTFAQGGGAYFNYRLQTKTGPGPNDVLIDPAGARQAQPCENQPNVPDTCLPGQANYLTDLLRDRAVNFINTSSEPFFLYMAPTAPHRAENGLQSGRADASASPWALAPPRYRDYRIPLPATSCSFNEGDTVAPPGCAPNPITDKPQWVQGLRSLTDADKLIMVDAQIQSYRALRAVDDSIKTIFATLAARLDNSIVIFLNDNGLSLGEHRWKSQRPAEDPKSSEGQKHCPYEECIRTRMAIRYPQPSTSSNRSVTEHVSNVDIAPTVADIANVTLTPTDGRSLVDILAGASCAVLSPMGNYSDHVGRPGLSPAGPPRPFSAIRTNGWKYVYYAPQGGLGLEEELYSIAGPVPDPWETSNLLKTTPPGSLFDQYRGKADALRERMFDLQRRTGSDGQPEVDGNPETPRNLSATHPDATHVTFDWTFNGFGPGQSQSGFALRRRKVIADSTLGPNEYWDGSAWKSSGYLAEVFVASFGHYPISTSGWVAGDTYEWSVAVRDSRPASMGGNRASQWACNVRYTVPLVPG